MASAPRFSGGRYKTFEARKAVVEKMITCVRRPSEIDSDQPGLCFREWNAHARSRPAIHDSDQKFTLLDPRLILERFIFREAMAMSAIGTPAFSSFRTAASASSCVL
jgi:hypothetical protein